VLTHPGVGGVGPIASSTTAAHASDLE